MDLKQYIKQTGKQFSSEPLNAGQGVGATGSSSMVNPGDAKVPAAAGSVDAAIDGLSGELPAENLDPLKQRITSRKRRTILNKLWERRPGRVLTEEEKATMAEQERRRKLETVLRTEAVLYSDRIINALNRRELCYRYRKNEKDFLNRGIQSVGFDIIRLSPDAIYLHIDTRHLPRGIGILNLVSEDILTDISLACQRRVTAEYTEKIGCWYIVERATGVRGIPSHCNFLDMLKAFPASADGLSIPFGMATNNKPIYRSLSHMYSLLVGGTVGSGKSNFLNIAICTLVRRNPPNRVQFLMVDMKGGMEFTFYEGIPHLIKLPGIAETGIVYQREQVPELLSWLITEGERRIQVIKEAGYKDIGRYNQRNRKRHLSHIVLVIDEYADIRMDHKIGVTCEERLANICQRFRAVGIHVLVCTQVPKSEVLSTRIKGVLPAKLAFSCPTNQASMAVIDNGHAKGLQPAGRCVFQWMDELTIQSPYITDEIVTQTVEGAKTGTYAELEISHDVTSMEVMEFALRQENGYLSLNKLYQVYRERGLPRAELAKWMEEWEEKEFIIGSSLYKVIKAAGSNPRRLISVEEKEDPTQVPTVAAEPEVISQAAAPTQTVDGFAEFGKRGAIHVRKGAKKI